MYAVALPKRCFDEQEDAGLTRRTNLIPSDESTVTPQVDNIDLDVTIQTPGSGTRL